MIETPSSITSKQTARRRPSLDERIEQQIEELVRFPEMGRPGRIEGTRELVIQQTPYIAAYQVTHGTVRVLRVLHGALQWPAEI